MRYYVVSDVHGYFSLMKRALQEKGFFNDKEPHKLILCGDMLDRGEEALEMQEFMLDLLHKGELIFIRGNHEDLMIEMLNRFEDYRWEISLGISHHKFDEMKAGGGSAVAYAWYIWEKGYTGETVVKWFN